jgi:hypothetical protein
MNATHHNGILHNDVIKDNIMLFSPNKLDVVYIIVCNWGEVEWMQEEQDVINMKKVHWWVAPKLFFVHGESIITNSFQHMVK